MLEIIKSFGKKTKIVSLRNQIIDLVDRKLELTGKEFEENLHSIGNEIQKKLPALKDSEFNQLLDCETFRKPHNVQYIKGNQEINADTYLKLNRTLSQAQVDLVNKTIAKRKADAKKDSKLKTACKNALGSKHVVLSDRPLIKVKDGTGENKGKKMLTLQINAEAQLSMFEKLASGKTLLANK